MLSTEQKRAKLLEKYPGSVKIKGMKDEQIHVVYMRLLNKGKL